MATEETTYILSADGMAIHAMRGDVRIGEITFVRSGADKMIIDYTSVEVEFRGTSVGLNLVRAASNYARSQGRKVITLCPFARAMFNRYPEFDDIRLMNAH